MFERINCYRRLAKINRAAMQPQVQEAVENHNKYQLVNATEGDLDPWNGIFGEESGKPHYTGSNPYERLEEVGYPNTDRGTLTFWEWSYQDDEDAVGRIDFWFHEPHVRQSYLQPAWVAGGYAEGPTEINPDRRIAYVNIYHQVPVRDHAGTPVIYPKDGQEDVPTSFEAVWAATASFGMGKLGYPITVTVGSLEHRATDNPHAIKVKSSSLKGPNGNIELFTETPDSHGYLRYSTAFYPLEVLAPNTTYTFEATMDWDTQQDRNITTSFTTGPESEPHGFGAIGTTSREAPTPPTLNYRELEYPITGH